jgi:ABC-type multidrug transport system ATPase subunit
MGLCPQENMVFPDLNVFEQIEFFGLVSTMIVFIKVFVRDVRKLL